MSWSEFLREFEKDFGKYFDISDPHFWGAFTFFWSTICALIWFLWFIHSTFWSN